SFLKNCKLAQGQAYVLACARLSAAAEPAAVLATKPIASCCANNWHQEPGSI
ncbi:hypothetical protein L195_g062240, partial [Trifolium pratense]